MNPLRDPSNKQIITHTDFKGIFSEIEVILGYNAKLLGELEERMKHWSFDICLGDIFAKIVRLLMSAFLLLLHLADSLSCIWCAAVHVPQGVYSICKPFQQGDYHRSSPQTNF